MTTWIGGTMELSPDTLVQVVFRDGLRSRARRVDSLRWEHTGDNDDVVEYTTTLVPVLEHNVPAGRELWQYEADKLLGVNAPPFPNDDTRRGALQRAGLESWLPKQKIERVRLR